MQTFQTRQNRRKTLKLGLICAITLIAVPLATPAYAKDNAPTAPEKKGCSLGLEDYDHGDRQRVQITLPDGTTQWISIKCNDGTWEAAKRFSRRAVQLAVQRASLLRN